jgi:transcription antitermination factor NusG
MLNTSAMEISTSVLENSLTTGYGTTERFADDQAGAEAKWYALYTRANHERRVAEGLVERGVENFLPQYESLRKWKDRRVLLAMPLFPGYVFVHLALQNRLAVLQVPGVSCLVGFAGKPAAIPGEEFERVRGLLGRGIRATPHPYLKAGRRVRVRSGPFAGLEGIIVRRNNRRRLVISLALIERAIAVEIEEASLEPLPQ